MIEGGALKGLHQMVKGIGKSQNNKVKFRNNECQGISKFHPPLVDIRYCQDRNYLERWRPSGLV